MTSKQIVSIEQIFGYTTLLSLEFNFDQCSSTCSVVLQLENPNTLDTVTLTLKDAPGLTLKEFGGGLTQLRFLTLEDIRHRQLDRINFLVRKIERGAFECFCRDFEITNGS